MRKKDFQPLTISSLLQKKQMPHVDCTIALLESLRDLPELTEARRMSLCLFIGVCTNGFATIMVNEKKRMAERNDIMLITDESVIDNLNFSDDFDGFGFFISYQMLQELLRDVTNMSDLFLLTHNHPVFKINDEEMAAARDFFSNIKQRVVSTKHRYRLQVVRLFLLAMIYDMSNAFDRILKLEGDSEDKQSRSERIFVHFVQLVESHYREQRQVQWYAGQMQLSPKYLCEVVSAVSRRSPNEWIDRFVVAEIRNQLRHTTKRISQISEEMNFPTQSFFGKYFKDNVGVSPTDYRNGREGK